MTLRGFAEGYSRFFIRGPYEFGRHITSMVTRKMEPEKARKVGGSIDATVGGLFTWMALPGTAMAAATIAGTVGALVAAPLAIVTAPLTLPVAALTVGVNFLFGSLSLGMTSMAVGLLGAAKSKLHMPSLKKGASNVGHAIGGVGHQIARPFKAVGNFLRHPFNKAARHGSTDNSGPGNNPPGPKPRPGKHTL